MWIDIYADSDEKNLFSGTGGDVEEFVSRCTGF